MTTRPEIELAPMPVVADAEPPAYFARALIGEFDFINAEEARRAGGGIDGTGVTVAVLDSGCRASHKAFLSTTGQESRVLKGRNFVGVGDTADTKGHGTAVSGIVAAADYAPVIAPGAKILPIKVVPDQGQNDFTFVFQALSWLLSEGSGIGASIICLSIGDTGNYRSVDQVPTGEEQIRQQIAEKIRELRRLSIPTVASTGNGFFPENSGIGMCFPAILPECISVGAVFSDQTTRNHTYPEYGGARVVASSAKQITPFSQRLPRTNGNPHFTRLFAPGAPIRSAGISDDSAQTTELHGTSIAAPFVVGVIALLQERHKKYNQGQLPSCDKLERWLLAGAENIVDADEGRDNVAHTKATFKLVDALGAINAMIGEVPSA